MQAAGTAAGCSAATYQLVLSLLNGQEKAAHEVCSQIVQAGQEQAAVIRYLSAASFETRSGLDVSFTLFSAYQVFLMQLG